MTVKTITHEQAKAMLDAMREDVKEFISDLVFIAVATYAIKLMVDAHRTPITLNNKNITHLLKIGTVFLCLFVMGLFTDAVRRFQAIRDPESYIRNIESKESQNE